MNLRGLLTSAWVCIGFCLVGCTEAHNEPTRVLLGKVSDLFPNIELRTQENKRVRFYDDIVKDKVVIINFMYTTCTGI